MKKSPLTFVPRGSSVDRSPESKRGSSVDRPRGEGEENFDNPLLSQLKKGLSVDRLTSQKSEGEEESKGNFEAAINPHPSSATREPSSSLDRIPSQESDSSKKGSSKKSLTDLESELKEKKNS